MLKFLLATAGQVITSGELAYVAKTKEFARRVRELRTELGYAISTRQTGRPDLKPGEYILESTDRISEPHDRSIPAAIQEEVYKRDGNRCCNCGWTVDAWTRKDPRILELHHRKMLSKGGQNTAENLCVLCSVCHDAVHARTLEGFTDE